MGACSKSKRFPYCSEIELRRQFKDLQAQDEREFGTNSYSGSWATIDGLAIDRTRTFHSVKEAKKYLDDTVEKREALAVVLVLTKPSDSAHRRAEAMRAKASKIERERLYPLTGQTVSTSGYLSSPTWEQTSTDEILARVRRGKSRTKGCSACGSSIAVTHIWRLQCPVCGNEFLVTDTERQRRDRLKARIAEIKATVKALRDDAKRIEDNDRTPATDKDRFWYVWGVAAI